MEILKTPIFIAVVAVNFHIARPLAIWLVEKRRPLFAFKPFTCAQCMAFWLTWLGTAAAVALNAMLHGPELARIIAGLALGTAVGLLNYQTIKNRIKIIK